MNAVEIVAEAIATYGRPLWVSHVPHNVRAAVSTETIGSLLATAHRSPEMVTRHDQHKMILDWCAANVFAEATFQSLADISGLTKSGVKRFMIDRPDLFRKIGHGKWEIRDPKADRAAAKTL